MKVTVETPKIQKLVYVDGADVFTLTIDNDTAKMIVALTGATAGSSIKSPRKYASAIYTAFRRLGFSGIDTDGYSKFLSLSPMFGDNSSLTTADCYASAERLSTNEIMLRLGINEVKTLQALFGQAQGDDKKSPRKFSSQLFDLLWEKGVTLEFGSNRKYEYTQFSDVLEQHPAWKNLPEPAIKEKFYPDNWPPRFKDVWVGDGYTHWYCFQGIGAVYLTAPGTTGVKWKPEEIRAAHSKLELVYRAP